LYSFAACRGQPNASDVARFQLTQRKRHEHVKCCFDIVEDLVANSPARHVRGLNQKAIEVKLGAYLKSILADYVNEDSVYVSSTLTEFDLANQSLGVLRATFPSVDEEALERSQRKIRSAIRADSTMIFNEAARYRGRAGGALLNSTAFGIPQ
jgi:hypothetical protein